MLLYKLTWLIWGWHHLDSIFYWSSWISTSILTIFEYWMLQLLRYHSVRCPSIWEKILRLFSHQSFSLLYLWNGCMLVHDKTVQFLNFRMLCEVFDVILEFFLVNLTMEIANSAWSLRDYIIIFLEALHTCFSLIVLISFDSFFSLFNSASDQLIFIYFCKSSTYTWTASMSILAAFKHYLIINRKYDIRNHCNKVMPILDIRCSGCMSSTLAHGIQGWVFVELLLNEGSRTFVFSLRGEKVILT